MEKPWISAYQPRQWSVYQIFMSSDDWLSLTKSIREDNSLVVCYAESEMADEHWQRTKSVEGVLFPDFEQILAMSLDNVYGADLRVLTKDWKGHPTGSLVMMVYKGVDAEPRYMLIAVAKQSAQ